jgi:hypothetical protein
LTLAARATGPLPRHAATGPAARSVRPTEPFGLPTREHTMGDKSPKQSTSKKPAGKSIKEKRLDKKAKSDHTSQMETVVHSKKH